MRYLLINTCLPEAVAVYCVSEDGEEVWQEQGHARTLVQVFARYRAQLSEVTGFAIVAGPGRFSSLRVGILSAHVLARWHKKPLFALTREDVATPESRRSVVQEIANGGRAPTEYVAPIYDREPNITTPRP